MRNYFLILLCTLLGWNLISCQDDEGGGTMPIMTEGYLWDGWRISDISLYCFDNTYSKVEIVKGYDDFKLNVILDCNQGTYRSDDADEMIAIGKLEKEYYWSKSAFILEDMKDFLKHESVAWPDLFTAYTNGEVTITCDKVLYGEEPGTNLHEHFLVTSASACLPVGIENPKLLYAFGDEIPTDMSKFFVDESWLQPEYYLEFADSPSEQYEELTLCLSIPMVVENCRNYIAAQYKGLELPAKYTEKEFKAECLIKFDWTE